MISHYDWAGGREAVLRFGPAEGPVVVAALPLLEEANRTRAFTVTILRALAERGVAGALPDLPGTGESLVPTEAVNVLQLQDAFGAAVEAIGTEGRHCYAMGMRSGALLDALALVHGRWHLAPQDGPPLLRELTRTKQAELGPGKKLAEYWYLDSTLPDDVEDPPVEIAGNLVNPNLLIDLSVKTCFDAPEIPLRTVRLETDPKPADRKIDAAPLWRRAEPDNDPALAETLADDIAAWVRQCEG
jgi:hypothetical protein